jgi:hypothetical protein
VTSETRSLLRATKEVLVLAVVIPLAASACFLLLTSLMPVRLDYRNFQDQRRAEGLGLPSGVPYLFVSAGTGDVPRHFYGFALHNFAFPSPRLMWIAPQEAREPSSLATRVDVEGRLQAESGNPSTPGVAGDVLKEFIENGVVLYDDEASRAMALARLPVLSGAKISRVLSSPASHPITRRPVANELSFTRWLRVASLLGIALCLGAIAWRWIPQAPWRGVGAVALGFVLAAPFLFFLLSWAQVFPLRSPGAWPYAGWVMAACLLGVTSRRVEAGGSAAERLTQQVRSHGGWMIAAVVIVAGFCGIGILRMDFEEDAHSHWLLMARSYYVRGRHVPELLTQHVLAATYPYSYPAAMAVTGWAADTPSGRFFKVNEETAVAILVYRVGASLFNLSTLVLVSCALRSAGRSSRLAISGACIVLFLFPVLQGGHYAAETLLFPLLASAVVLVEWGLRVERSSLLAAGLFIAASCALVKLEGAMLAVVCVGPWLMTRWKGWRTFTRPAPWVALAFGAIPAVLWKATLAVRNGIYETPSVKEIIERRQEVGSLEGGGFTALMKDDWLPLLLVILPLAWMIWIRSGTSRADALCRSAVPLATFVCILGFPLIYLFSALPHAWQLTHSYQRLMMPELFGVTYFALLTPLSSPDGNRL